MKDYELMDLIDQMDDREVVKALSMAISSAYNVLNEKDPERARKMLRSLRMWLNEKSLWENSFQRNETRLLS